jgi:RNA binding exosome subunit
MPLSQVPIAYIDLRFSVHATEDLDKVLEAVKRILPADYVNKIEFQRDNLEGHFGNPIILFETRIKGKEIIKGFIDNLSSGLSELDKDALLREIDLHVENGSLYLRLDKQSAYQGQLKLCSADPIRVHIRFRRKRTEDIVQICRELGMLP